MLNALLHAARFLTRLPLPEAGQSEPRDMGRAMLAFPLVGLVIGLLLLVLQWMLGDTDALLAAALVLLAWVVVTGGLHLDGLADTADASAGGNGDPDRTLDILKDTHSGAWAVMAVALVLLVKFAALKVLLEQGMAATPLVVIPLLGRSLLLGLFMATPYVRPQGLGQSFARELDGVEAKAVLIVVGAGVLLFAGRTGLALVLVAILTFWLLRRWMMRRIGGTTGDTAGALVEIGEAAMLVAAALLVEQM